MPSDNIYVQIVASQGSAGKSRSVVVQVPKSACQPFQEQEQPNLAEQNAIAQRLAEPFARYAFTHRAVFDHYELSYAFFEHELPEIKGRAPQLTQNELKAWVV